MKISAVNLIADGQSLRNLLSGFITGILSFWLAELVCPKTLRISEHDHLLANCLGLIYSSAAACWIPGKNPRTLKDLARRLLIGLLVGSVYSCLSSTRWEFSEIMVLFPSFFGAALTFLSRLSMNYDRSWAVVMHDCFDGMTAGFILGLTYSILFNVGILGFCLTGFLNFQDFDPVRYVQAMSWVGPCAFGIASCLFFFVVGKSHNESAKALNVNLLQEAMKLSVLVFFVITVSNAKLLFKCLLGFFRLQQ